MHTLEKAVELIWEGVISPCWVTSKETIQLVGLTVQGRWNGWQSVQAGGARTVVRTMACWWCGSVHCVELGIEYEKFKCSQLVSL